MPRDFFDPLPTNGTSLSLTPQLCATILERLTGSDSSVTDYILEQPAKCPKCRRDTVEKTLNGARLNRAASLQWRRDHRLGCEIFRNRVRIEAATRLQVSALLYSASAKA